jgi:hypothetical protein
VLLTAEGAPCRFDRARASKSLPASSASTESVIQTRPGLLGPLPMSCHRPHCPPVARKRRAQARRNFHRSSRVRSDARRPESGRS